MILSLPLLLQGIRQEKDRGNPRVLSDTIMLLTWAGDGAAGQNSRRNKAGCRGFCTGRLSVHRSINPTPILTIFETGQRDTDGARMECDEFPLGMSSFLSLRTILV